MHGIRSSESRIRLAEYLSALALKMASTNDTKFLHSSSVINEYACMCTSALKKRAGIMHQTEKKKVLYETANKTTVK